MEFNTKDLSISKELVGEKAWSIEFPKAIEFQPRDQTSRLHLIMVWKIYVCA